MPILTMFVDSGVRSSAARAYLKVLEIPFNEVNIEANEEANNFLNEQQRPASKFNLPQFYVGNQIVWENGFKDLAGLSATQINEKIEEINARI